MSNLEIARGVLELVRDLGVRECCVCAGSRNSPLIIAFSASDLALYSFIDERSASFFALGRSKLRGRPVAVLTTSGTAVAEMLSAAVEAYYSGVPLILISADRPERYRGTGAPQAIEQEGIFGPYASRDAAAWDRSMPLHINVPFDEPLLPDA
jgi:2-succinyl-5-enolpyruvyl-6-hydroxy-3-cyclohexene-1-carboxylate synthase